jgi:hypothetical protein
VRGRCIEDAAQPGLLGDRDGGLEADALGVVITLGAGDGDQIVVVPEAALVGTSVTEPR